MLDFWVLCVIGFVGFVELLGCKAQGWKPKVKKDKITNFKHQMTDNMNLGIEGLRCTVLDIRYKVHGVRRKAEGAKMIILNF